MTTLSRLQCLCLLWTFAFCAPIATAQERSAEESLDNRVRRFLESQADRWRDMNISVDDGKFLHDLIVQQGYKRALEIGTSTGHSAIWIAWALSKTGGRLITVEIDEERYNEALRNFEKAGLSKYIDARLADAHVLVKELKGLFDFVFSDADKEWYVQYFIDIAPKMAAGGCFAAHNISGRGGRLRGFAKEYVDYLKTRTDFETIVENDRTMGMALSYKRKK